MSHKALATEDAIQLADAGPLSTNIETNLCIRAKKPWERSRPHFQNNIRGAFLQSLECGHENAHGRKLTMIQRFYGSVSETIAPGYVLFFWLFLAGMGSIPILFTEKINI